MSLPMRPVISNPLIRRVRRHQNMSTLFRMATPATPSAATGQDETNRPSAVTGWVMGRTVGVADARVQDGVVASDAPMPAQTPEQWIATDPPPPAPKRTGLRAALAQVVQPFRQLAATQKPDSTAAIPDTDAPVEEMAEFAAEKVVVHQQRADATTPILQAKVVKQTKASIKSTPSHKAVDKAVGVDPDQAGIVSAGHVPELVTTNVVPDPPATKAEGEGPNWPRLMAIMEAHERKQQQGQNPAPPSPSSTIQPKSSVERPTGDQKVALPEAPETQGVEHQPSLASKKSTHPVQREPEDVTSAEAMDGGLEGPPTRTGIEETALPDADDQQSGQIQVEEPHGKPAAAAIEQSETMPVRPTEAKATVDNRRSSGSGEFQPRPDRFGQQGEPSDIGNDINSDIDVEAMLRQTPPAKQTDSAIHIITPRGRRPLQMRHDSEATPAQKIMRTEKETQHPEPVVETEIGDLPVDLWALIGESPPIPQGDAAAQEPQHPQISAPHNEGGVAPFSDTSTFVQMSADDQRSNIEPPPAVGLYRTKSTLTEPEDGDEMPNAPSATGMDAVAAASQNPFPPADAIGDVLQASSSQRTSGQTLQTAGLIGATAPAPAHVTPQAVTSATNGQGRDKTIQPDHADAAPVLQRQSLDSAMATLMRMEQTDGGMPAPDSGTSAPDPVDGQAESSTESADDGPDLTTLALRVYAQIRRRLIIEQERLR